MAGLIASLCWAAASAQTGSVAAGDLPHPDTAAAAPDSVTGADLAALRKMVERGRVQEALAKLEILAAAKPEPTGVETLRGDTLYSVGKFLEADKAYALALQQNPTDLEAAQMRGLTLFRLGRPADAVPFLEAAQNWSSQTRVDPSYVLGLCYLDTRQYDKARGAFAQQYDFAADSAQAYLLAARLLLRREYLPVAESFARKALTLDPQLPLAHALLGEIALAQQHLEDAIKEFELEKQRNPLDGNVYEQLGDAYSRSGENLQAQRSLQRALLLEPYATGPLILLGKVLLKEQDAANAVNYLQRAIAMDPQSFRAHTLMGQAYRALGRTEDAAREIDIAQKIQAASEPKLQTVR